MGVVGTEGREFALYLMIDNYDSFTYNLVQLFGMLGIEMAVHRNDEIGLDDIRALAPEAIVVSPGPCTPDEAGISMGAIETFIGQVPLLGVCLGHQSMAQVLGGKIVRATRLLHGKTSPILHDGSDLYRDVSNPFEATRYHSLIARAEDLPSCLRVTAKTWEDEIMGFSHRETLCIGVQYHPESVLTTVGPDLMKNFIDEVAQFHAGSWEASC